MLDHYRTSLSAGQQQRVGIARAIVSDPALVVLDEPTSALDPTARAEIIDLLLEIQKATGTSYLFISHDLSAVHYISHRIAVMYLGMIVEQGPAAEVFRTPRHPYSVGLLSSVLLPDPKIRRQTTVSLKGEIPSPIDLPTACFLAGRCPFATDVCYRSMPPREEIAPEHFLHCYHHDRVAEIDQPSDTFAEFQASAERVLGVDLLETDTGEELANRERQMGKLDSRIAIVTGAAGGLGQAIALLFAKEGADIAIVDLKAEGAEAVARQARDLGRRGLAVVADVSDETQVGQAMARIFRELGEPDILVNNAGIDTTSIVEEMPTAMWDEMIRVNLKSVFLCTRAVLPAMRRKGYGRIVNISSQLAQKGGAQMAHYAAAKAGVLGFTRSLSYEVAKTTSGSTRSAPDRSTPSFTGSCRRTGSATR